MENIIIEELIREGFPRSNIASKLEENDHNILKTIFDLRFKYFSQFTSQYITLWRLASGLTVKEFAKLLNVSYDAVRKWERNERNCKSSCVMLLEELGYKNVKINVPERFFEKSIKQIKKWSKQDVNSK